MSRYKSLDSWRGVCALLVALFHLSINSHLFYLPIVRHAGLFVDFFFVLSGFVLAHAYGSKIVSIFDAMDFAIRRFGRLWPLHIFILALFLGLEIAKWLAIRTLHLNAGEAPFSGPTSIEAIFTNLFLIQSLGLHKIETWNGPSWSISTEFWVNIIYAAIVVQFAKRRILSAAIIITTSLFVLISFNQGMLGATYDYGVFRCLYGFFAGLIAYRLHQTYGTVRMPMPDLIETMALAFVILFVSYPGMLGSSLVTPIVFVGAILIFARENGVVSRLLCTLPLQLLGQISYSIYMVHFFLIALIMGAARTLQQILHKPLVHVTVYDSHSYDMLEFGSVWLMDLVSLLYVCAVIGISWLTYNFIEDPGRIYFNAHARRCKDWLVKKAKKSTSLAQ